ncbi:MAG TPA: Gfo/Idh/MocA family oxidoreductase [Bryobacteraceae bacterium]|nr:Gfo/Idh/MocA family oxidoreductase [Bryobacteraceae bacterium]
MSTDRRDFLRAAGAVGAFTIMKPRLVRGSAANSAVRVGLLGCGRRGSTDAANIAEHTDARIVALADLFQDQMDRAKQRFDKVAESKGYAGVAQTFLGPNSAQQLFESKEVDAVVIATPAYFHPLHLAGAVGGRKHVYLEKPVAVDPFGAKAVIEISQRAQGAMNIDVGFQIRSAPPFVEMVRRIHGGALGEIAAGEAHYNASLPGYQEFPNASLAEQRIRNWLWDRRLSGDFIVEQNIHVIDICNWVMQGAPERAVGRANQKGRAGVSTGPAAFNDCSSHFDVIFDYPNNVQVSFSSVQFGKSKFDVSERFFGTKGSSMSPYSGTLGIDGDEAWTWAGSDKQQGGTFSASGAFSDNLAESDSEKQKGFITAITSGQFHNQLPQGVESALTCMMGRQAAYAGREVTWGEMLRSTEKWDAGIDVNKLGA